MTPVGTTDIEQRYLIIFANGKEAGSSKMTIVRKTAGSTDMTGTVDVKFHLHYPRSARVPVLTPNSRQSSPAI
jgi:hypothetical protein